MAGKPKVDPMGNDKQHPRPPATSGYPTPTIGGGDMKAGGGKSAKC